MEADIGTQLWPSKTIQIDFPDSFICPEIVDKNNWLNSESFGDTFSVKREGNELTVDRTDRSAGWGLNLRIQCCLPEPTKYPTPAPETSIPTSLPSKFPTGNSKETDEIYR